VFGKQCKPELETLQQGNLVKLLHGKGVDVIGIDRFSSDEEKLIGFDWLEYNYETDK
jgi:hypothetical protein